MTNLLKSPTRYIPAPSHGVRRALGVFCLALGITGCVLPIIPGLPFLVVSARLLGRRDPLLRRLVFSGRALLRRLRTARHPRLRSAGVWLAPRWQRLAQLVMG
jgi:hypothetical protein